MIVGTARIVLHVPHSRSLKEKRQVVRSVIAQTQHQFQMAVAEIEEHDRHQVAVLGLACLSTDAGHADEMLSKAVNFVGSRAGDAYVTDYQTEILHAL